MLEVVGRRIVMQTLLATSRETMDAYMAALAARGAYPEFFAPDIVLEMVPEGPVVKGAAAVEAFIRGAHEQAFDAQPLLQKLVVEGDHAAAEIIFDGTHTGEFAGIAATGKHVRVPYTAFYDLAGGRITAIRLYALGGGLVQQVTPDARGVHEKDYP
jgi:predicted ester cyclase